ncbi:hypothetical protein [Clostridium botulinum]|uniref:hypothetical protein n=1 Tax=Clostridium botulinum TaxID=1491 RepID=UPI0007E116BC|nr:hypothetical protein [Clostridium botulinum]KEI81163.1 hypothetical protein N487_09755 [Clostridium botulinum B2 331]KEI92248.1 hypothetical protein N491_10360 [Clostridium botulinum B2 275]NEZ96955.1 hypothetical protein [Clostridium botulinum]NFA10645.1 hypothetical protein [Clostridium botulinum]NFA26110.1 hypothetical protein [Clostridium botulinum]
MDKGEIEKTIKAYLENGIVTQKDVDSMGDYSSSKKLHEALEDYLEENCLEDKSTATQIWAQNRDDYQDVIYDTNIYSYSEVKEYMNKYVLNK